MKSEDDEAEEDVGDMRGFWLEGGWKDDVESSEMEKKELSEVIDGWKQSKASANKLYNVVQEPYQL
jgi:hypothetical protein